MESGGLPGSEKTILSTIMKILYLQYTNPGAYPPLEHSSQILAEAGWEVVFLGTGTQGSDLLQFPFHKNIRVIRWPFFSQGMMQKVHYALFGIWCWLWAISWKPAWIYGSDPIISPVLWAINKTTGCKIVYHEHDSPQSVDKG